MDADLEESLVERCRRSDRAGYTGLVRMYSGRVFGICLGMIGHREDAEDMAQQALLQGFAGIKQLRDGERFGAWIGRITRNLCVDHIRRQGRTRDALAARESTEAGDTRDYGDLESALAELPEKYRLVLLLYYFDGRSTKSIAESLGISPGAAQTRLSRARKQLRKLLQAKGEP
ncbi:MAG: sigma-70 family RNA polymerase sigma factor [Phycisphaerales bacterium]|nr:MAG: sigma-70 family RNA polymerase sigma factor [Phycisphaerales bacterium]